MNNQKRVLELIRFERNRQDKKWGSDNLVFSPNPLNHLAVISEEVGEAAKAILENNPGGYQTEILQIAAVCVAILEGQYNRLGITE